MSRQTRRRVSIAEAAESVGVSERTIRRLIAAGELQAERVGKRLIRIDVEELDKLGRPIPTMGKVPA